MCLSNEDLYNRNISLLKSRYSDFTAAVIKKYPASSLLSVSEASDGQLTARIDNIWIHSSRAPGKEAQKLAERSLKYRKGVCIVFGFGLGFHIEELHKSYPELQIIVAEHEPALFLEALYYRDFSTLFRSERIGFLFDIESGTIASVLSEFRNEKIQVLKLRPLCERSPDYYNELEEKINSFLRKKETNMNTLRRFGKTWVKNLFRNIEIFFRASDAGIVYNRFNDFPALVIAAGPSLDMIIPYLPGLRKRCVIICVDTALSAVTEAGILPDFIVVVDPQYLNTRHLDILPGLGSGETGPFLVSESSTHPSVFKKCALPVLFFKSIFPLGKIIEATAGIVSEIGAGGSVATTAWDLGRKLGCSKVFTVGLDLGFPLNNTHCRTSLSSLYTELKSERLLPSESISFGSLHNADPRPEENNAGSRTLTDSRLIIYKWWFEGQLQADPSRNKYYNMSEFGVRIEGMQYADAETVLQMPECRDRIDAAVSEIRNIKKATRKKNRINMIIEELVDECRRLESVCSGALKVLEQSRKFAPGSAEYTAKMNELSEYDRKISDSPTKELSEFVIQPVLDTILNEELSAYDNSKLLYSNILESGRYHRIHAEKALNRIRQELRD